MSDLKTVFIKAWQRKTSADPKQWSKHNPAWGQCAVTAVLAQEIFGGDIVRITYTTPDGNTGSHYFNILPNGDRLDLTKSQFCKGTVFQFNLHAISNAALIYGMKRYIAGKEFDGTAAEYILSFPATLKRYKAYKRSFKKHAKGLS